MFVAPARHLDVGTADVWWSAQGLADHLAANRFVLGSHAFL